MKKISNFLRGFRNDVFKLLPMKEAELEGVENHVNDYLNTLVENAKGSIIVYPELAEEKDFLYTINNLAFLSAGEVNFKTWRKIILGATHVIDDLYLTYGGVRKDGNH